MDGKKQKKKETMRGNEETFLKGIRGQGRILEHIDHKSKRERNYLGERKSSKMEREDREWQWGLVNYVKV